MSIYGTCLFIKCSQNEDHYCGATVNKIIMFIRLPIRFPVLRVHIGRYRTFFTDPGFFCNTDPDPDQDPDPGKEYIFSKEITKILGDIFVFNQKK